MEGRRFSDTNDGYYPAKIVVISGILSADKSVCRARSRLLGEVGGLVDAGGLLRAATAVKDGLVDLYTYTSF